LFWNKELDELDSSKQRDELDETEWADLVMVTGFLIGNWDVPMFGLLPVPPPRFCSANGFTCFVLVLEAVLLRGDESCESLKEA